MTHTPTIALCGNPNCGKTTIFNLLTGSRHQVGNWPGVTVEKKYGKLKGENSPDKFIRVVDLPGTYSLDAVDESLALDEKIARNYILSEEPDLIVNIIDASNVERNLYLTTQLLEIGKPVFVLLNMMDVAKTNNISIDINKLSKLLGCPVFPLIASKQKNVSSLTTEIQTYLINDDKYQSDFNLDFEPSLECIYQPMLATVRKVKQEISVRPEWLAVRLIEEAHYPVPKSIESGVSALRKQVSENFGEDIDIVVAEARYGKILQWIEQSVSKNGQVSRSLSVRLDKIFLHKYLGIPLFLFVTYLMFLFTINFGGALVDFFDQSANAILVEGASIWLADLGFADWLVTFLANGVGGGVQVVSTFIPIIGSLYLFLAVLEDSGYLARGAFVMDRFMQSIGLPGKSFIPLMVGLGCTVPAIYATRSLEYEKDRIMTVMMSPFISCGARLPVYILFAAVFFPDSAQNLIFALYLIGITIAVLTGLLLKKTLLSGENTPFVMELPAYHMPQIRNVLMKAWEKLRSFVLGAGKLIVLVVIALSFLNSLGTDMSFGNENTEKSVLTNIGKTLTPAFEPIGIKEDNWPATVGLFTGLFAKEVIVGTIDSLYMSQLGHAQKEETFVLNDKLADALQTIPDNLSDAVGSWSDPLGVGVDVHDTESIAEDQGVSQGVFSVIRSSFDGTLGAFSYLLFILLYSPCVSALGATYKETGKKWTLFSITWTTFLAYSLSTIAYQLGQIQKSPATAISWIALFIGLHLLNILGLRFWSKKYRAKHAVDINETQEVML